jgi:hypothetical protein
VGDSADYYIIRERAKVAENKMNNPDFEVDTSPETEIVEAVKYTEKQLKLLRDMMDDVDADTSISLDKRLKMKGEYKKEMTDLRLQVIEEYYDLQASMKKPLIDLKAFGLIP